MPDEFARLLLRERNRIFASIATITTVFMPVAEARADDVAVGDQLALSELTQPDRFAWPAVFADATPAMQKPSSCLPMILTR